VAFASISSNKGTGRMAQRSHTIWVAISGQKPFGRRGKRL